MPSVKSLAFTNGVTVPEETVDGVGLGSPDLQPVKLEEVGAVAVKQKERVEVASPAVTVAFRVAVVEPIEVAGSVVRVAGLTLLVLKLTQDPVVGVPGLLSETKGESATTR